MGGGGGGGGASTATSSTFGPPTAPSMAVVAGADTGAGGSARASDLAVCADPALKIPLAPPLLWKADLLATMSARLADGGGGSADDTAAVAYLWCRWTS